MNDQQITQVKENPETALSVKSSDEIEVSKQNNFVENFRNSYKIAKVFSQSKLIPERFQGNINDCTVAVNMAIRMNVDPIMVMQNLYVVKGKPSWSGQACMSFIKAKYPDAKPVYVGQEGTKSRACYIKTNELTGVKVSMEMAEAEGWLNKPGSKWKTMPELMLAYRAAAFFARVYCPESLMGIMVQGEAEDTDTVDKGKLLTEKLLGSNT